MPEGIDLRLLACMDSNENDSSENDLLVCPTYNITAVEDSHSPALQLGGRWGLIVPSDAGLNPLNIMLLQTGLQHLAELLGLLLC